jgi:repressor of nif and glnA expression
LASIDALDTELLYAVAEATKQKRQISTWELAKKYAKTPSERNTLDGVFRYRLYKLAEKGLLEKVEIQKNKRKITLFQLPKTTVCYNGSFFIFTNPITILACPYYPKKCPSTCHPVYYGKNKKIIFKGCPLIQNAPEQLKQLIYQHLENQP